MSKAVVKANNEADSKTVPPTRHIPYGVRRRLSSEVKTVVVEKIVEKIVEKVVEVEKAGNSQSSDAGKAKAETAPAKGGKGKKKAGESIESPAAQTAENTADISGSIEEKNSAPVTTGEV